MTQLVWLDKHYAQVWSFGWKHPIVIEQSLLVLLAAAGDHADRRVNTCSEEGGIRHSRHGAIERCGQTVGFFALLRVAH